MGSRRSERGLGEVQGRRPVKKRGDFFRVWGQRFLSVTGWQSRSCAEGPRGRLPPVDGGAVAENGRLLLREGRDAPAQRGPSQSDSRVGKENERIRGAGGTLFGGHGMLGKDNGKTRMKSARKKNSNNTEPPRPHPLLLFKDLISLLGQGTLLLERYRCLFFFFILSNTQLSRAHILTSGMSVQASGGDRNQSSGSQAGLIKEIVGILGGKKKIRHRGKADLCQAKVSQWHEVRMMPVSES